MIFFTNLKNKYSYNIFFRKPRLNHQVCLFLRYISTTMGKENGDSSPDATIKLITRNLQVVIFQNSPVICSCVFIFLIYLSYC